MANETNELLAKITQTLEVNTKILETLNKVLLEVASNFKQVVNKKPVNSNKKNSLRFFIIDILKEKGELTLANIVEYVIKSEYKTKSSNFTSVVYQNLRILCNEGIVCKNKEFYLLNPKSL